VGKCFLNKNSSIETKYCMFHPLILSRSVKRMCKVMRCLLTLTLFLRCCLFYYYLSTATTGIISTSAGSTSILDGGRRKIQKNILKTKLHVPKLALAARGVATTATRSNIRRGIPWGLPSLSGIAPPLLPEGYAELKSLLTAGWGRVLAESWEKLLPDREKDTAVVKRFGSDACLFPLIPSFPPVM